MQENQPGLSAPAEVASGDRRDRPRRFRIRYSLRTLIVLVTISALVAALWSLSRRLERATVERDKLRYEQGYLQISDPEKMHAVGVKTSGTFKWRWRVFLPEGRQYRLHSRTASVSPTGIPPDGAQIISVVNPGEFLLEAVVEQNRLGNWVLSTEHPSGRSTVSIRQTDRPWIEDGVDYSMTRIDVGPTKSVEPGNPIVLLRLRVHDIVQKNEDGLVLRSSTSSGPVDGLLIWIEEKEPESR